MPETTTITNDEASKIFGLLYTLGIAAAAIFVKNPAHQQTASNIIGVLNAELPTIQGLIAPVPNAATVPNAANALAGSIT